MPSESGELSTTVLPAHCLPGTNILTNSIYEMSKTFSFVGKSS